MTGLVLCQKHILAVRWVMGKYWQFNFLKADFYPGALMEMVVVLHYFCAYVSGRRASVALRWKRYAGVPGSAHRCRVCGNSSLPLEVAPRLDLEAGRQLFLLQQLCTRVAGHPGKHRFGDSDPYEPSKVVEILVWFFFFLIIIFWWRWPGSSDLPRIVYDPKTAPMGVCSADRDLTPK